MAISLFIHPKIQFLTDAGAPLNGGKVYFYIPGTTTDKDTYTDQGGTVANANPGHTGRLRPGRDMARGRRVLRCGP